MTYFLEDFTDFLPPRPNLDDKKAEMLQKAEAVGMAGFLRVRSIFEKTVAARVDLEISDLMTARVAEIAEQRGLIDKDLVGLLGFEHTDPDEDFIAAITDAVQVSFIYEIAEEEFKDEERRYQSSKAKGSKRQDVQDLVKELATSPPALAGPTSLHALDEMIAELHAGAPWMSDVSNWAYKALRAQYAAGRTWIDLPPVILIGPPGSGKTTYARKLAKLAEVPVRKLDAAASNASFTVVGSDATWGNAQAGVPLQEIAKTSIANPIMIVDEIDKAGIMKSSAGMRVSLPEALLGLLEPTSAFDWECPYTRRSYNMSQISWIMTANEIEGISAPLLDRCRVFNIGYPVLTDLSQLIRKQSAGRIFDEVVDCLIERVTVAVAKGHQPSLRRIQQLIDEAAAVSINPVMH